MSLTPACKGWCRISKVFVPAKINSSHWGCNTKIASPRAGATEEFTGRGSLFPAFGCTPGGSGACPRPATLELLAEAGRRRRAVAAKNPEAAEGRFIGALAAEELAAGSVLLSPPPPSAARPRTAPPRKIGANQMVMGDSWGAVASAGW